MWKEVDAIISKSIGRPFQTDQRVAVGGGCINEAFRISSSRDAFFVKRHHASMAGMFESEFEALSQMDATKTVRVPKPVGWGVAAGYAWLVTEFLDLTSCQGVSQQELGKQLAHLHLKRQPHFGWLRDNTVGSTPQPNPPTSDWIDFWREHRLGWQFELAHQKGGTFSGSQPLLDVLDVFFEEYEPSPSLLHGDLWSGNMAALGNGMPVVFDPASYFGDAEAEFGIIDMFGGFADAFYKGYASVRPFDEGFQIRRHLYRLYHELNHFNLFGSSYATSCESTITRLLRMV